MVSKVKYFLKSIEKSFVTVINDMIPKGTVVNDMTPKEIVHLLYLGICFETVINDMDQKNTMLFVKNI